MVQLADQKKPEQEFNFRRVFKATFGSLQSLTMLVLFWGVVVEAMALILLGHLLQQHQKRDSPTMMVEPPMLFCVQC